MRLAILFIFIILPFQLLATENPEESLKRAGLSTLLGKKVDLNLTFTESTGTERPLRDFFSDGKPVIMVPVYYGCPRLCGLVLDGVVSLLNKLTLNLGQDYRVVTVSFDDTETPELAKERLTKYHPLLTRGEVADWHFLVGKESSVKSLMEQIGFNFERDGSEFVHSAAIMLLTPEGQISQYFTGIDFPAWDLRLALVEASQGNVGSALDHVFLFCFRFDQIKGKYTWAVYNLLKVVGVLTIVLLGGLVFSLLRKERASQKTV